MVARLSHLTDTLLKSVLSLALTVLAVQVSGCASMYFRTLDESPVLSPRDPSDWPWQEYWAGVIFNGSKIGFSRQQFQPEGDGYSITSQAALRLRFLMIDKQFASVTRDRVDASLQLRALDYEFNIDNSRRTVKGIVQGDRLVLEVSSRTHTDRKSVEFEGELVPISAIYLYPVLHGMAVGKTYSYQVFDGESLAVHPVEQKVVAWQSSELFKGKAFKLETATMGLTTTVWLDSDGLPQLELSLNGALISALEPEDYAKEYLAQAVVSKSESLLAYSMIPVAGIDRPRSLEYMHVRLDGLPATLRPKNTSMQRCRETGNRLDCIVTRSPGDADDTVLPPTQRDLIPSFSVNSAADEIVQLAEKITVSSRDDDSRVMDILKWLDENIEQEAIDSFNALDVLSQRKAECQGHSLLFAAFARSLGIPTRVLNGVVYSEEYRAFLYHTWVESHIDNRWQAIDPTFGQRHADATHIVLIEGEELAELIALLPVIGRLQIEVLETSGEGTSSMPF